MTGRDAFKIWAQAGAQWGNWIRPVPFATMSDSPNAMVNLPGPNIIDTTKLPENAALIIDAPGSESVLEGIALARLGFRPIPLFNGANGQEGAMALVDHYTIEGALKWGASELEKININTNAPPVFLLDSNRTHRYKMNASIFDNSWDLYSQDMPSAEYFLNNGIYHIIVKGETIQKDLRRILYQFQKKGIAILFTNGYNSPKKVTLKRPRRKRN